MEDTASLSLFIYPNSLFVFAKDKNQANISVHHHLKFSWNKMEDHFNSDPLLKLDVPAKVYIHSPVFTLVPGVLYQQGKETEYLELLGDLGDSPHFFTTPVDSNNIQILSFLPQKTKNHLEARFSEVTLFHGSSSFFKSSFIFNFHAMY